ncbi:MAG TPA: aminotransferase class V-fold PLP-dependent enzyme [Gaiellaceae bacterium]|nr:aminotransferase class V-fold PLP-dependent enzyme [Gaiellaceae bacterium]
MTVDWDGVRADYPALAERAYLDTACKGLPSSASERAIADHVRRLRESPGDSTTEETIVMLEAFGRARSALAALIHAEPDEIALVPSTESGIAAVAAALALEPGSNVIASDLEFIGTVLPWRFRGHDVRFVPHREGTIDVGDLLDAADERTRAVVVSSVQEVNGFRVDLDLLGRMCRERSILLVADAIQHVGPLPLDVREVAVDAVAVGGHKWLCAPFGMGFTYVSRRIHDLLRPPARAFMTAEPPAQGWTDYLESLERHPGDRLTFPNDARKLETAALGTTLAAAGIAAAAETLLRIGPDEIAERSARLVARTAAALEGAGARIVTPAGTAPSSIVTFRISHDLNDERELVESLAREGVLTSLRSTTGTAGIRVSPYFYNDDEDIDRLAAVVERHIRVRA